MNFLKLNNQIETILKISNNNFMNDSEECTYIYMHISALRFFSKFI